MTTCIVCTKMRQPCECSTYGSLCENCWVDWACKCSTGTPRSQHAYKVHTNTPYTRPDGFGGVYRIDSGRR